MEQKRSVVEINDVVLDEDYTHYMIQDHDKEKKLFRIVRIGDCHPFTLTEQCVKDMYLLIVQ